MLLKQVSRKTSKTSGASFTKDNAFVHFNGSVLSQRYSYFCRGEAVYCFASQSVHNYKENIAGGVDIPTLFQNMVYIFHQKMD